MLFHGRFTHAIILLESSIRRFGEKPGPVLYHYDGIRVRYKEVFVLAETKFWGLICGLMRRFQIALLCIPIQSS
jgi:hypothetical protein